MTNENDLRINDADGAKRYVVSTERQDASHIQHHVVDSTAKKFRDNFAAAASTNWTVTTAASYAASASAGVLTITTSASSGGYAELLSLEAFRSPFRVMCAVQTGARQSNTQFIIEMVSVDSTNFAIDELHAAGWEIGGSTSTTVTQGSYFTQTGGLTPVVSSPQTITSTTTYSVLEFEANTESAYFYSNTLDSTSLRAQTYLAQTVIPDPNAYYKMRIRALNIAAWKTVTGAIAGTANVIRLTCASHGYSTGNKVWVECLSGVLNSAAAVRGFFTITVVDANTFELNSTVFGGTYVAGSGRCALGTTPTSSTLTFKFLFVQDYSEVAVEVVGGRGQATDGQAIKVTSADTGSSSAQIQGSVAAAATDSGNPVKVGGKYNSTLPTYTDGQRGDVQLNTKGMVRVEIGDSSGNALLTSSQADATTNTVQGLVIRSYGAVFNGTTWDRRRGDTTGAWTVGNAAAGAADSGNPVKVGGKYNATLPTYTDGQRGDLQVGSRGSLRTTLYADNSSNTAVITAASDGASNSSTGLLADARGAVFNGTTWDRLRGDTNGLTVQTYATNPTANFTRPANTTAYAANYLVANSTTAGSVSAMTLTASRFAAGSFMVRRLKLHKSGTSVTSALFRVHLFRTAPATVTNGDGGAFSVSGVADYLGAFDVNINQAFTDGACGFGVPVIGADSVIKLASGSSVYALIETKAAYTPANAEVFTLTLEVIQN